MAKKRERLEVIKDIIMSIRENRNIKPTRLLYASNLSPQMFKEYINELITKKFISLDVDDKEKKTLVSVSSIEKEIKANKKKKSETSTLLGEILAKRAAEKKITKVYFDRGAYKYHGRIKMFADSLRKNGLEF